MRRMLLIILIGALGYSLAWAESYTFVYDDHNKRDPFRPLVDSGGAVVHIEEDLIISDMVLEGIMGGGTKEKNLAIVNGKILKLNDHLGLYTVVSIESNRIILRKDNEDFVLQLKKEAF